MSIIRIGLAETKNFSEGYDLIFAKKDGEQKTDEKKEAEQKVPDKTEAKNEAK